MGEANSGPIEGGTSEARTPAGGLHPFGGLSTRLLLLTILFVMIAEILIYVPSIANYRNMWLAQKVDAARVAAVSLRDDGPLARDPAAQARVLAVLGLDFLAVKRADRRDLISLSGAAFAPQVTHDLSRLDPLDAIRSAFATLLSTGDRPVAAIGPSDAAGEHVEIQFGERALRDALRLYSRNVLLLSLAISGITATLVFFALRAMIVNPIRRVTDGIVAFSEGPEDAARIIVPSGRNDEIGRAEERLAAMQQTIRDLLAERRHLADLGLAVSKINHDLRNILASAQLFSDRLRTVDDPLVSRLAPKIMNAIDRAIAYTRSVLSYGQAREEPPRRRRIRLRGLVGDVADVLGLPSDRIDFENRIADAVEADTDPDQLYRVFLNLVRNAQEAMATSDDGCRIVVEAERLGSVTVVRVGDTGPGVPEAARRSLFQPFRGSARPGGTGLGLAIAAELVRAHGGDIALVAHPERGAVFEFSIPDRPIDLQSRRQAKKGAA